MTEKVLMPQLGESVTEGTIGHWLKKVGEPVEKYESLLEILTDKVNAEVPSPASGVLAKILVEEGQTVPVGTPIAEIAVEGAEGEAAPTAAPAEPSAEAAAVSAPAAAAAPVAAPSPSAERGRFSPAVRRLAREHGIDPASVAGTGAGGRVTLRDILRVAESAAHPAPDTPPEAAPTPAPSPAPAPAPAPAEKPAASPRPLEPGDRVEPLSQIRRLTAERMVEAKTTIPHAWIMVEVDVTGLVALRERWKAQFQEREGVNLTYLPFMLRATVEGLRAVPQLNAQWNGDSIIYKQRIHLGIAVATERGLVVPVIRDADQKNVVGLAHAVHDLTERARKGRLTVDDLRGGTFTVDNTGAVGTYLTYAVINAPEVGIVTMESIARRPVVVGDAIAIRSMVNLCLSFDHRVVDGADAARFLNVLKRHLEALGPDSALY
ncbi:MAG: 2-oxo acid dehydrogenase subunit E2 [Firmicutes bacterium]|nr:2-oxo acid dehydrogenase subunit E2 [Alicyclobacillaceae bacterium]MCL6496169.1 2-oxo acid dehydrogenase subunit E2 [Bacillota bacterium]